MKLTLRRRLWAGFGMMIVLVGVGSSMGWWVASSGAERTKTMIEINVAEQRAAEAARASLLQAREAETEFLLQRDEQYAAQVKEHIGQVQAKLTALQDVSPDAIRRQKAASAGELAGRYFQVFEKSHQLMVRQGLTADAGFQGELLKAVHAIEQKVTDQRLAELTMLILMCRRHEKDYMLHGDEKNVDQITKGIDEFKARMVQSRLPQELQTEITGLWKAYSDAFTAFVEAERTIKANTADLHEVAVQLEQKVVDIAAAAGRETETAKTTLLKDLAYARWLLLLVLVIAALFGCVAALSTVHSVTRPIRSLLDLAKEIAAGNLTAHVPAVDTDELGQLAIAFNALATSLHSSLVEVAHASGLVASASQQLAATSGQLSAGSQEQASALEETAASMEEMTATVKQNAGNARQASQLATGARDVAEKGGEVVTAAVGSMGAITTASKKIADISTVIDEIAFQTNLLALNAAVEAARAGEQGRGFAVVAGEVRNLAQRSAAAAKEIKGLIQNAGQKVEDGAALVNKSGQTLQEIVNGVKQVSDIVAEIAAASQEQSQGIEQVNKTVAHMDALTQGNTAQTEQLSSTAQSLAVQAWQLQTLVGRFKLENEATDARGFGATAVGVTVPASPRDTAAQPNAGEPTRANGMLVNGHADADANWTAADFKEF